MSWIPIATKGGASLGQLIAGAVTLLGGGTIVGKGISSLTGRTSKVDSDGNITLGGGSKVRLPKIRISGGSRQPTLEEIELTEAITSVRKALGKLIGSTSDSIIKYKYRAGQSSNIRGLKESLSNNPSFIEDVIEIVGIDRPKGTDSNDIIRIISGDENKRKALLEALKGLKLPDAPNFTLGGQGNRSTTSPEGGEPDDGGGNGETESDQSNEGKAESKGDQQGTKTKFGEVTKKITSDKTKDTKKESTNGATTSTDSGSSSQPKDPKKDKKDQTKTKTKTKTDTDTKKDGEDDEDDRKPPRPIPIPDDEDKKIRERPINSNDYKRMAKQQWFPRYKFGNQDLLRLTEVEKLEELKNYTLFDLVNPLLVGDEDNLLALQNKIQENRRFTNTYPNPKPEAPLPLAPAVESWRQPFKSVYPVPYPMSLDQAQAQNYYDHFNNQDYQYLNKVKDRMSQGGLVDPDMQKLLNNKRDSFTATDAKVMNHQVSKLSLLEDIDSGSVTQLDLFMLSRNY